MTNRATGTFDVKLLPQAPDGYDGGGTLGRMTIDKLFQGDIEGTSKGQMLTAMCGVKGSAGYVAVERVTGTVHGKRGSFALLHRGLMDRGAPSLDVVVVPDSGTDELVGISGTFNIIIEGKLHSYELDYDITAAT
ncbi:MAG: DUF3224 domain-containing protein [Gemmatimonadota bacterium]|nr:DUF3224 domain-containing protein [Gemmatimonadota bacterium]